MLSAMVLSTLVENDDVVSGRIQTSYVKGLALDEGGNKGLVPHQANDEVQATEAHSQERRKTDGDLDIWIHLVSL